MLRRLTYSRLKRLQSCSLSTNPLGGYYILLPEEPRNIDKNPIVNTSRNSGIPKLEEITVEDCVNSILKVSLDLESSVWTLEDILKDPNVKKSFKSVLGQLERQNAPFSSAWGIIKTLSALRTNLINPESYEKILDRAKNAKSWQYQSLAIYYACKELSNDSSNTCIQHRLIDKYILEAKLSGIDLQGSKKLEHTTILNALNQQEMIFEANLKETTPFKQIIVDTKYFGEMPTDFLALYARDSAQPQRGPWTVTLESNSYKHFMEYCPESALRWNAWLAYNNRGSGEFDKKKGNSLPIEEIREKRADIAKLLGFKNYVELSMQTKMAGVDNVKSMINTLLQPAKEVQDQEFKELSEFSFSRGLESTIHPWDIAYWRRKMKKSLYNVDDQVVREYFPFEKTFLNLCSFAESLFKIKITPVQDYSSTLDEHFRLFQVSDNSAELGHFFLDPFKRRNKMPFITTSISIKNRCDQLGIKPLSCLVFNFEPPRFGRDTLLTYDQLYPVFREFGTLLQQVLTKVPYSDLSGTTNIEWDALRVPSNFMALWLGNSQVVRDLSSHEKSGEQIPQQLLSDLLASRKHFASFDLCRELYISALDIELYETTQYWKDIAKRLYPIYSPFKEIEKRDAHLCSLSEIFTGDYAAAYYSNLWSKLLAADLYRGFVESVDGYASSGIRFRETFLETGGGCHPSENFRNFRGRDPSPDALLWSLGLRKMPHASDKINPLENEEMKV